MQEKRTVHRFTSAGHTEVEIVFVGLTKIVGSLRDSSEHSTYILTEEEPPDVAQCFLRMILAGKEYYSRGTVVRKDEKGVAIRLENWFPVFSALAMQDVLSKDSTLEQVIQSKKNKKILGQVESLFDAQRKPNCWELTRCDKESFCPAGIKTEFDGFFGGKNGGRFCAFIPETFCKDGRPRMPQEKMALCANCSFYHKEILAEIQASHKLK